MSNFYNGYMVNNNNTIHPLHFHSYINVNKMNYTAMRLQLVLSDPTDKKNCGFGSATLIFFYRMTCKAMKRLGKPRRIASTTPSPSPSLSGTVTFTVKQGYSILNAF